MGLVACGPSASQMMIVKTQCQATTMRRLNARTRSMKRSRLGSVLMPDTRSWWPIVAMVPVLVGANLLNNRLAGPAGYVLVSVATSLLLIGLARHGAHRSWDDLGLAR